MITNPILRKYLENLVRNEPNRPNRNQIEMKDVMKKQKDLFDYSNKLENILSNSTYNRNFNYSFHNVFQDKNGEKIESKVFLNMKENPYFIINDNYFSLDDDIKIYTINNGIYDTNLYHRGKCRRYFDEVLTDVRKLYLDIDINIEKYPEFQDTKFYQNYINYISIKLVEKLKIFFSLSDLSCETTSDMKLSDEMIILDASNHKKRSCHIIFQHFKGHKDHIKKFISEFINEYINTQNIIYHNHIDLQVYQTIFFRLMNSVKYNSEDRPLKLVYPPLPEKRTNLFIYEKWCHSHISHFMDKCKYTIVYKMDNISLHNLSLDKISKDDIDIDIDSYILSIFPDIDTQNIQNVSKKLNFIYITYNNKKGFFCKLCNRTHDHTGLKIKYNKLTKNIYQSCFRHNESNKWVSISHI